MTKKHVIILSVLVNAGLLLMLCIGALTSKEKSQNFDVAKSEEKSATVQFDAKTVDQINNAQPQANDPVVHKIPEAASPFSYAQEQANVQAVLQEMPKQEQPITNDVAPQAPQVIAPQMPAIAEAQPQVEPKKDTEEFYTIQVGDNPWTIAMKHHMKVGDLLKLNHLNNQSAKKLRPGHRLRIR